METFLVIGVETVSRGITQGEVGAVIGGVLLICLVLTCLVVWRCWGAAIRHRLDAWARQLGQGQRGRADEGGVAGAAIPMAVLPPVLFRRP